MSGGRRASSATTRARILAAARLELSSSPGGDFSTRTICDRAEVTAPTLYHHFGDKEGLLEAILNETFDVYLAQRRELPLTDDPVADFVRGCHAHVEFGLAEPVVFMAVYGRPDAQRRSAAAQRSFDYLMEQLRRVEASGRLLVPIAIAADLVDAALSGVVLHLIRFGYTAEAPFVALARDGLLSRIVRPPRLPDTQGVPRVVRRRAKALAADLAGGPLDPLSDVESAMLREWLERISSAADL